MAYIVCIIGNKGGTGKTTLTHLLAHGLGLLDQRAVAVLTEQEREPLTKTHRTYLPVDARTPEALARVTAKLKAVDGWFGIVDGGGNRPDMDQKLSALADLVLLPFRDSHEDFRTVTRDLDRFPHAYAVPSQWPTNVWQLEAANRMVAEQLADVAPRVLAPLSAVSATKLLLQIEAPESLPTQVNNAARMLAWRVIELLDAKLDGLAKAGAVIDSSPAPALAQPVSA
jgi:hypothetical protein